MFYKKQFFNYYKFIKNSRKITTFNNFTCENSGGGGNQGGGNNNNVFFITLIIGLFFTIKNR